MKNYIVATIKPWNIASYARHSSQLPGQWTLIQDPRQLTADLVEALKPRYIFFPHWSWRVCPEILARAECVCFHASNVPYGRGGSPIQNLIERGHDETKLCALLMVDVLDAGPVYLKQSLSLTGRAQEIFERMAEITWGMIARIVADEPEPREQVGESVVFARRRPEQSSLPLSGGLAKMYDHIRMLDADTYPAAFLSHGEFRLEFDHAEAGEDAVTARVTIRRMPNTINQDEQS
jgi:methionyl-tRNA formyltransferase